MQKNYTSNPERNSFFSCLEMLSYFCFPSKIISSLLLLLSFQTFAQFPGNDNTPGAGKTFNVPPNVTSIRAEVWGAGGSGGGSTNNNLGGSGGGGGGYTAKTFNVAAAQTITYTVGAGATGVSGASGNTGNTSSLTHIPSTTTLTGNGGSAGLLNLGAGATGGLGGTGVGGTNFNGGIGSNSTTTGAGGGAGGNGGGAGGTGGVSNANGNPGSVPGGGGSGGEFNGGNRAGGAGGNGQVTLTYISVSSITPNPVCTGNTITITGTNFAAGASTVTINGTACTSVTTVSATSITAVVAPGTTSGVVVITNPNGTNNGLSITVNPSPAAIGGGAATVCTGIATPAFTNATVGGTWSITNGTGSASITTGGVVTGTTAGTVTVNYTVGSCSSTSALTVLQTPSAISGGAATVCTGLNTPAFTNVYSGGTWSITNGTGTASITAGGVVTGLTAGTVTVVYTISTCTPATIGLTVNQSPATIGGGAPSVCIGNSTPAFKNTTAGGIWSITAGTGTASINSGGIVTGLTAGSVTVNYTLGTCVSTAALTVNGSIASLATTPVPANASTGICYSGGGAITDLSWTAAAGAVSYDIYFSTNPSPAFVVNQSGTTYTLPTTLLANTTYYWKIVPIGPCGTSTGAPIVWSFTTSTGVCYCTPSATGTTFPVSNVTFAGINNNSSAALTAGPFYENFSAISGNVILGSSYTFSATASGFSPSPFGIYVFFDWNNNGDFSDDGGPTTIGTYTANTSGVLSKTITIPVTAAVGTIRFRVSNNFNSVPTSCPISGSFQDEDYSLNITTPACTGTPTTQPTALVLTPVGQSIDGSFTNAVPKPDQYLVVISTSAVAPTPVNGTTYNIGDTVGAGYTVVDNDSDTTFNAGALNSSTTYYIYVFSLNSFCPGSPLYRTASPLTGSATTGAGPTTYCTPVTTSAPVDRLYVSNVEFVGTLLDTSNASTTDATPDGYQDFTALTPKTIQAQGGPINMKVTSATSRGFWKVWVDWNKDGDFTDSGEEVYNPGGYLFISTTFGFVVPTTVPPGNYRMRVRVQNTFRNSNGAETLVNFDSCNNFTPVTISGINYTTYGEAEDYLFTVISKCDNKITSITNPSICGTGTATLSATGTAANVKWYDSLTGGTLLATTASGANFTTPVISSTTTYYVTSSNATCETLTRIPVVAEVKPVPVLSFANPSPTICGENSIIQLDAADAIEVAYLINEDFEGGSLGVFSSINSDATTNAQKSKTAWKNKTSIFIPTGNRWFPAITSGFGTNKFALTSMDDFKTTGLPSVPMENSLTLNTSVNPSATGFTNLTLTLKMFYSRYYADGVNPTVENANVEVSTNGGSTWTTLPSGSITADQGYGSNFVNLSYNLDTYVGSNDLKVRVRILGDGSASGTAGDGVAVDDIKLFGNRPLTPYFTFGAGVNAFTDAAATIPYTGDRRNTIWLKPTLTQLEQATFPINVTSNLSNGCNATGTITVTNNSKVWKGTVNSDWSNAANWSPSTVPTASNCVIIPGNTVISGVGYNAYGKNLSIKSTGNLELQSENSLTISDWIDNNPGGVFNVRSSGNLIQVNNISNVGNINIERTTNIRRQDYVFWSSPVANFSTSAISPSTSAGYIFKWLPTIGANTNGWGNWTGANETMTTGKGYIVRGPDTYSISALTNYTATFTGVPNNGNLTTSISRGTYNGANYSTGVSSALATRDDDNWNLVGNPYPSSINAISFLNANTNIAGFVKIWTHGNLPSNAVSSPFYNTYSYNYTPGDYITYNATGTSSGPSAYAGNIPSGQGFFVLMNHTSAATTENLVFNNTMRSNTYSNSQFFRNGEQKASFEIERNRIWIDLISPSQATSRNLVGYIEGATNGIDRLYDAKTDEKLNVNLYSISDLEPMTIQGRQLPFDPNDKIDLGIKTNENGTHTIAIAAVDGLFDNQIVYIEDKQLNITHNLKQSPYTFTTSSGNYSSRFQLKFSNELLSTNEFESLNGISIFTTNSIVVQSKNNTIKSISVYDILGKTLLNLDRINKNEIQLTEVKKTDGVLLVKVTLENGQTTVKKVIF